MKFISSAHHQQSWFSLQATMAVLLEDLDGSTEALTT
jgi:hypothetical protein